MKNKLLIYDDNCPLCKAYSSLFVRCDLLPPDGRLPFSTLDPALLRFIDFHKSRNEIPLLDTVTGEVYYGIDALLEILGGRFPLVKSIGKLKPVDWLLRKLYRLISFNRKVIVAKKCNAGAIDCTPDNNYTYRFLLMILLLLVNTVMLIPLHHLLFANTGFYTVSLIELESAHFSLFFANCLLAFSLDKLRRVEYIGQVSVLSFTAILVMMPLLLLAGWLHLPDWLVIGYLFASAILIFKEYLRRMEYVDVLSTNKWIAAVNLVCMTAFILFLFR